MFLVASPFIFCFASLLPLIVFAVFTHGHSHKNGDNSVSIWCREIAYENSDKCLDHYICNFIWPSFHGYLSCCV